MEENWITPRFYDDRPCTECGCISEPKPPYVYRKAPPFQAACRRCRRKSDWFPTWREALSAFYGELPGRSPRFGPQVGDRFVVKECEPMGCYPLCGLKPGDIVCMLDFHVGAYTVQRESDGLEVIIQSQNVGEVRPWIENSSSYGKSLV